MATATSNGDFVKLGLKQNGRAGILSASRNHSPNIRFAIATFRRKNLWRLPAPVVKPLSPFAPMATNLSTQAWSLAMVTIPACVKGG